MSDYAVEIRTKTTRARGLGDATPIYRAGESKATKAAGEKTHGEIEKTMTERLAVMRDAAEMTTRCAIDDCTWTHVGPAGEARQVALDHRQQAHPSIEKDVRRCTTPGCTGRAVRRLDICPGCSKTIRRERATASAMRARGLNRDGTRLLEEVASATDGDVGAASSSSTLNELAAAQPDPQHEPASADARMDCSAAPTGEQPSGQAADSNTTTRRAPMRSWTRESLIAELQQVAGELGHTPTAAELTTRKLGSMLTKKFLVIHGLESYRDLCVNAGLKPNTAGGHGRSSGRTVPPREAPLVPRPPEPEPAVQREPLTTAEIPYDIDVLEREAAFLRRRADALDQMAAAARALAQLDGERAA